MHRLVPRRIDLAHLLASLLTVAAVVLLLRSLAVSNATTVAPQPLL